VLVHWQTRKHALANMKAPWRGEALRGLHIDAADLVRCITPPGLWFSLLYMKVSACRLKPFTTL
jgi:hypothetical protein